MKGASLMRIEIQGPTKAKASEQCHLRAVLFNDSYEPVAVSRNALIGPNVNTPHLTEAVEATFGGPEEPLTLHPFTFYGRERSYTGLPPGEVVVTAYYRNTANQAEISSLKRLRIEQE
jgi:hypothetical protein